MSKNPIDKLMKNRVSWLADNGPEDDIAITSRIRLARNLNNVPFPICADHHQAMEIVRAIQMAVDSSGCFDKYSSFIVNELSEVDRKILLERRLISKEFLTSTSGNGLIVSDDESFGVMINEEDHIRLQAMMPGLQLKDVWSKIDDMDSTLSSNLPIAYDEHLGYLTSCPTNVGTGMRASVMLHLPGLVLSGQINPIIHGVSKLGLAVRGILGEGTENLGNLFQVSNQSTLGESELQIIERLDTVIKQIINHEKNSRNKLLDSKQNFLLDHVGRAYGILKHAYLISSEETLNSLSALRLGVDMGMFSSVDIHTVNELFVIIQPAHLQKYAGKELSSDERDVFRASLVRERLRAIDKKKE